MIEIRSYYHPWHEAAADTARRYVQYLLENMQAVPQEKRAAVIEKNHLRGCTVEELLGEKKSG